MAGDKISLGGKSRPHPEKKKPKGETEKKIKKGQGISWLCAF